MKHLIEVDTVSSEIIAEWRGEGPSPVAPEGRTFVDITSEGLALGVVAAKYTYVNGELRAKASQQS